MTNQAKKKLANLFYAWLLAFAILVLLTGTVLMVHRSISDTNKMYDDIMNYSYPPITTVHCPCEEDLKTHFDYDWMTFDHVYLLEAIAIVESNKNDNAVGDNGKSIGRYQIQKAYWKDAVEHKPNIGGEYEDILGNYEYSTTIVYAYWDRYGKRVGYDFESLARIHNGGPTGYKKESTVDYWKKVKTEWLKIKNER